ncbi:hypothetical protein [Candidatus Protochlamydia phocaeensis]|uniref:hypothetical protein n=1 Tax=Candidatus Protochlamydia phocaeensis TaxID=1414722 RepID=UPI000AF2B822|nr:hypothetical protein [Candidatus Protochlamydia phocaeensis]
MQATDTNPVTNKVGVRFHNWLGAFVCNILAKFGLASDIIAATINGRALYLNKGSVKKWCEKHE